MAENGSRFRRLALALASGLSIKDAAEHVGVSERTAHRALKNPRFAKRVRRIHAAMREQVVGQLTDACTEAVRTLRALLDPGTNPTARLGAARAILEHASRLAETVELEARIAALETEREARNAPEFATAD